MDLAGKKVMVIGGAGLIGSHVVDELLKTDVGEIVVFDNFFRGSMDNLKEALQDSRVSISPHGGDILQRDVLERDGRDCTDPGEEFGVHHSALSCRCSGTCVRCRADSRRRA